MSESALAVACPKASGTCPPIARSLPVPGSRAAHRQHYTLSGTSPRSLANLIRTRWCSISSASPAATSRSWSVGNTRPPPRRGATALLCRHGCSMTLGLIVPELGHERPRLEPPQTAPHPQFYCRRSSHTAPFALAAARAFRGSTPPLARPPPWYRVPPRR